MKTTPEKLTEVTKSVAALIPGMTAQCSKGVATVFNHLFGKTDLNNKSANNIVYYLRDSPEWEQITGTLQEKLTKVQNLANEGWFVVAGKTESGSGHVAVIVPGTLTPSYSWKADVPAAFDTGINKRWSGKPLSNSWRASDSGGVEFFRYK